MAPIAASNAAKLPLSGLARKTVLFDRCLRVCVATGAGECAEWWFDRLLLLLLASRGGRGCALCCCGIGRMHVLWRA